MLFTSPKLKKAIVCGPSLEKVHTSHMCLSHICYWTWEGEGLGMYLCLGYAWVCHQALALVLWSSSNVCFVHLLLSTSFVVTTPEQQQVKAQYSHLQQGPWMADSGERNLDFSSGPSCVSLWACWGRFWKPGPIPPPQLEPSGWPRGFPEGPVWHPRRCHGVGGGGSVMWMHPWVAEHGVLRLTSGSRRAMQVIPGPVVEQARDSRLVPLKVFQNLTEIPHHHAKCI